LISIVPMPAASATAVPPGDAGDVHKVAGEDEERHRQQWKAFHAGDHALRNDDVGCAAVHQQIGQ
jgi:hypothetical protein